MFLFIKYYFIHLFLLILLSCQEISYELSPEEDNTVSSASICMSPTSCDRTVTDAPAPLYASTPYTRHTSHNGHDRTDSTLTDCDVVNGNVHVNIISESTNSMDVLSGGESDAYDTLSRRNNNSIQSSVLGTLKESTSELPRRRNCDINYYVAKELLMTERTYKRDLEYITVLWSGLVSGAGRAAAAALARGPLALEPLALRTGAFTYTLDKLLHHNNNDAEEPEYKKIADILYEYLSSVVDMYVEYAAAAGRAVCSCEAARRGGGAARRACSAFEARAPLPLACLLLRPLHRALHLHTLATELEVNVGSESSVKAVRVWEPAVRAAREHLPHVENHAALCQMQRDITGYDKLLVPDREFLRMGCVYKHSSKGLQQRMLFLFNDVLLVTSKCGSGEFRAHAALPLHALELRPNDMPNSFTLQGPDDSELVVSAGSSREYCGWCEALHEAAHAAPARDLDTALTPHDATEHTEPPTTPSVSGGGLAHVCWHRGTSLDREQLHLAMRTQLSGYLLRKFKKSPGWQKLWVVFAAFTLFFYKSWQDDTPLASLPLLGYSVGVPSADDGIDKDYVFKLQFKNHVYFFRADSDYTYSRWTEVLGTAMTHPSKSY